MMDAERKSKFMAILEELADIGDALNSPRYKAQGLDRDRMLSARVPCLAKRAHDALTEIGPECEDDTVRDRISFLEGQLKKAVLLASDERERYLQAITDTKPEPVALEWEETSENLRTAIFPGSALVSQIIVQFIKHQNAWHVEAWRFRGQVEMIGVRKEEAEAKQAAQDWLNEQIALLRGEET